VEEPPVVLTCGGGTVDFSSQIVDILACTTVDGANVQALDPNGIPYTQSAAVTSSTGTFGVCLPGNEPFTLEMTAAMYPTTYFGELEGEQGEALPQLGLISSEFLAVAGAIIPNGFNSVLGVVIVKVNSTFACSMAQSGWSVGISLPDGGALPDGGYQLVYINGAIPMPGLTSTQAAGAAILYNIDPTLSEFFVINYSNPDAGACQATNVAFGLTGRVYVPGNAVSVFPILLP
jgi:hypothetical protein